MSFRVPRLGFAFTYYLHNLLMCFCLQKNDENTHSIEMLRRLNEKSCKLLSTGPEQRKCSVNAGHTFWKVFEKTTLDINSVRLYKCWIITHPSTLCLWGCPINQNFHSLVLVVHQALQLYSIMKAIFKLFMSNIYKTRLVLLFYEIKLQQHGSTIPLKTLGVQNVVKHLT